SIAGVTPLADRFAAHGLPLADVQSAVTAFEQAAGTRITVREGHASARAGIRTARGGARQVIARLDAVVANTVHDPMALAAWAVARRMPPSGAKHPRAVPPPAAASGSQAAAVPLTAAGGPQA